MKVTAETITDEQLLELMAGERPESLRHDRCGTALRMPGFASTKEGVEHAREFCAAAWNARHGGAQ